MGERCKKQAGLALSKGHKISARQAYLRAFTYFRWGINGLHPKDPLRSETYQEFVSCFQKGAALLDTPVEPIQVPWKYRGENVFLAGVLCTFLGVLNAMRALSEKPIHYALSIPFVK